MRTQVSVRDVHAETVEMAILDKELAKMEAEKLQLELEEVQDLVEKLTLDLEKIKPEMSERAGGETGESTVSKYEMKQSEKQNSGFPDILMRIQDLSACGKHEFQKLQKDMD